MKLERVVNILSLNVRLLNTVNIQMREQITDLVVLLCFGKFPSFSWIGICNSLLLHLCLCKNIIRITFKITAKNQNDKIMIYYGSIMTSKSCIQAKHWDAYIIYVKLPEIFI